MTKSGLPRSLRKFLRREKARIRRDIFDPAEAEKRILELVEKSHVLYTQKKRPVTKN